MSSRRTLRDEVIEAAILLTVLTWPALAGSPVDADAPGPELPSSDVVQGLETGIMSRSVAFKPETVSTDRAQDQETGTSTGQPDSQAREDDNARIEALEAEVTANPERLDLRWQLVDQYEQAGRIDAAINEVRGIQVRADGYRVALRLGWLSLKTGARRDALKHYKRAAKLVPESEEAWLGVQLTYLASKRWLDAVEAGKRVLEINSSNYYAQSRNAYAWYMARRFSRARKGYETALEASPDDPELLLGLGFTRLQLGDKTGTTLCSRVSSLLTYDDARVSECLELGPVGMIVRGAVYGTYLSFGEGSDISDFQAFTAAAGVQWPSGIGLEAGVIASSVTEAEDGEATTRSDPVVSLNFKGARLAAYATGLLLTNRGQSQSSVPVIALGLERLPSRFGLGAEMAGSFYPGMSVFQVDPYASVSLVPSLTLKLGPGVQVFRSGGTNSPSSADPTMSPTQSSTQSSMQSSTQSSMQSSLQSSMQSSMQSSLQSSTPQWMLLSGLVRLDWTPSSRWMLYSSGYVGSRMSQVEHRGWTVWDSDELYKGGYRVGTRLGVTQHLSVSTELRHDITATQDQASAFGATVGVSAWF